MRSKKIDSIRMPWRIWDRAKERCHQENYRSMARYIIALVLRDVIAPQKHLFIHSIANADPELQDDLLDVFMDGSEEQIRAIAISAIKICRDVKGKQPHQ